MTAITTLTGNWLREFIFHFPSRKYPLSQNGSSYAYGLETTIESLVDWLLYFCDRMDISMLNGIQTYLSDR